MHPSGLKKFILDDCLLERTMIDDIMKMVDEMKDLQELHLVSMGLSTTEKAKEIVLHNNNNLEVLNLRGNNI